MHDVVAGIEVQERVARARWHGGPRSATPRTEAVHQFRLGDQHQPPRAVAERETAMQVADRQMHAIAALGRGQEFAGSLLLAFAVGHEPRLGVTGLVGKHCERGACLVGKDAKRPDGRLDRLLRARARAEGPERDRGRGLGSDLTKELVQGYEPATVGHPIREGAPLLGEFTELDEDRAPSGRHDRRDGHARSERRRREFGSKERCRGHRSIGGLRGHVDLVQPFEVVTEEVEANRHRAPEAEDIEQAAAHREFARLLGHGHARVPGLTEPRQERCLPNALTRAHGPQHAIQRLGCGQRLHRCGDRGNDHDRIAARRAHRLRQMQTGKHRFGERRSIARPEFEG